MGWFDQRLYSAWSVVCGNLWIHCGSWFPPISSFYSNLLFPDGIQFPGTSGHWYEFIVGIKLFFFFFMVDLLQGYSLSLSCDRLRQSLTALFGLTLLLCGANAPARDF